MNFACLSNTSNEDFSYLVNKNISGERESEDKCCSRRVFYEGVCGADLPAENNHEPLDASHGAQIMANEYKRQKEQVEENIAALKAECNDKEIAFLKETLSEKEKKIAHLKEELFQVQQHGQRKEFDFFKQMATIDEELRKAKNNIDEAAESLVNNKAAEVEELHRKLQTFNSEDYFHLQPSWFDTLRNNVGCLEVHYPITARDRKAHMSEFSESSSQKKSNLEVPEAAKAENYFDLRPSWFDTLPNNVGCLQIENSPVTARDFEANKTDGSNSKLAEPVKGENYFDLQPSWFDTLANNVGSLEVKNYAVTARELVNMCLWRI